ncbi:MAG: hypothetical protein ACYTFD_01160 [Planctomycetota bacterium]|jgi:hypothetical protein
MEFATPVGFWLGLAAGGVLLAHLVRRRARPHVVPFLPLWAAVLAHRRGGLGSTLVRRLDLLCVLLACAAIALAAGGPFLPATPGTVRDLVLVLDGGVSLRAGVRHARLLKVAEAEIERRAPTTRFVVIGVTDQGATVATGGDAAAALAAVRAHRPGWWRAERAPALDLAREAARRLRDADLVWCTHRPGRALGLRLRTVVEEVPNAGVASLDVVADPEGGGYLAQVDLRGEGPLEIEGHWSGVVDGRRRVEVPLPAAGEVVLRLRAPEDGFAPDDAAYLLLPERTLPRLLVVASPEPSPFLTAALQALLSTAVVAGPLDRTTPDRAEEAAEDYDVLIFDRCAPPARTPGLRALFLAPPPGALPFRVGEWSDAPALFEVQRDHPVLKGFDLSRVVPLRARAILGGEALASAAPGPVLGIAPGWIALGFDPDRCVLAASPAYPLFLRNCVAHLARAAPATRAEFHAVNEAAPLRGVATVGTRQVRVGERLLGPPGFWRLGEETLAVNLLLPDLDLRPPTEPSDPLPPVGVPGRPRRPLTAPFGAAAILLLLVAWWAFWRS